MLNLTDILNESLMDDEDTLMSNTEKSVFMNWVNDNAKGDFTCRYLKDGTVKIRGNMVIKGYSEEKLPDFFTISQLEGNLSIEKCPKLTSLEGLFNVLTRVRGNFAVNNCPKLTSLEGSPEWVEGSVSFIGNSSLKDLSGMPKYIFGPIYIMKNGKKFKDKYIKDQTDMIEKDDMKIFCSMEDDSEIIQENMINESFNEKHLLLLDKQLKEDPRIKTSLISLVQNMGLRGVPWDEIDSSNVEEYTDITPKVKTLFRNHISGKNGFYSLILLMNGDNKCKYIIIPYYKRVVSVDPEVEGYGYDYILDAYKGNWMEKTSTLLVKLLDYTRKVVFINADNDQVDKTRSKSRERFANQSGRILNTPEQNLRIAKDNIERYKQIIAKNKANRDEEIEKIDEMMEKVLLASVKAAKMARTSSDKYIKASVSILMDKIGDKTQYSKGKTYGSDGLFEIYNELQYSHLSRLNGDAHYDPEYQKSRFKKKYEEIQRYLSEHFNINI